MSSLSFDGGVEQPGRFMVIEVRQLLGGGTASLDRNAHGIMDAMVMMIDDAVGVRQVQ
jgi:hypothetical protein